MNMRATDVSGSGVVNLIEYIDQWGDIDYIEDNVDLCDRAGCRCDGHRIVCDNDDSNNVFFVQAIHDAYARQCSRNCDCLAMPEEEVQGQNRVQVGDLEFIGNRGGSNNVINRLNPEGAAMGHGACLAGEAAGWTFKKFASKKCCQGYSFQALSAQEAYANYGVAPHAGDIVAGIVTIGVCLKSLGG